MRELMITVYGETKDGLRTKWGDRLEKGQNRETGWTKNTMGRLRMEK